MTESQNMKNEQQIDLCPTSEQLTKQWKKGELIDGKKYYITFFDSEPFEATFRYYKAMIPYWKFEANGKQYCNENGYDCVKVLAPVPTCDEWKKAYECVILEDKKIAVLKELLKECELWFTGTVGNINDKNVGEYNRNLPIGNFEHTFKVFSQKINQILGGDK